MSQPVREVIGVIVRKGDSTLDRLIWYATILLIGSVIFSTALMHTAAVALMVLWVAAMISRRRILIRYTPFTIPYLAFVIARILAIPLSIDPATSAEAFRTEIVFYLLFFVFSGTIDLNRPRETKFLLQLIVWTGVIAAVVGTAKVLLGFSERAASTSSGFYTLGLYLCVALPLILCTGSEVVRQRWQWILASAIVMLGIVFTYDRIHWAGMFIVILVAGVIWERRLLVIILGAGAALVAFVPSVHTRLMETIHILSYTSGRDVIWRGALMILDQHPVFGFGLRTFHLIFPLQAELPDQHVGSWHNDILQVYMESGLVGTLAFVSIFVTVAFVAARRLRAKAVPQEHLRTSAALLTASGVVFVVGGFLDTHVGIILKFMLALLGMIFVAEKKKQQTRASEETP